MRALFQNITKGLVEIYLLNLDSQLSGGAQTEHLGLPHGGVNGLEKKNVHDTNFMERCWESYLQDRDGEGGCFAGTRLRLGDHISSLDDRLDGALLDGRGLLETIGVDAPEEYKFNFWFNPNWSWSHLSKSSLSAMESKVGMTSTSSLVSNSTLAKSSSSTPRRVSFDAIFLFEGYLKELFFSLYRFSHRLVYRPLLPKNAKFQEIPQFINNYWLKRPPNEPQSLLSRSWKPILAKSTYELKITSDELKMSLVPE